MFPNEMFMNDQIVITEKTSQAKDVRAAIGSRYGVVLPAEGHLFDLLEPEDVVPEWKRWSAVLVLSRFSSGLFRAMFAMKEIENGKEDRRVPPRCG